MTSSGCNYNFKAHLNSHTQIINSNENNKTAENKHDKIIPAPVPFLLTYFFL